MAAGNRILVTPEELISAAQRFADTGNQVNSLTQQMMENVNSVGVSWQGEASTAYIKQFSSLEQVMQRLFRMIQEHSNDLQEMARNYQSAETANQNTSNALPKDVI